MRFSTFICAALLIILTSQPRATSQAFRGQTENPIAVVVSNDHPRITLHEPVILTLHITNNSSKTAKVDLGRDRKENLLFSITTPDGKELQLPQLRKSGFSRIGKFEIAPGESYSQHIVLNEWFDFKVAGTYHVVADLAKPVLLNGQIAGGQAAFQLPLQIGPRSAPTLARRCQDLLNFIESSNSYEHAAESALALSYVNDPVGVPFLEKALEANRLVEPIAISGLERIGNSEAVAALIPALKMTQNNAAILARSALLRIEARTQDPSLKDQIQRALDARTNPDS
ncbi:MAG: HEAT repeat domain-containing protein [Candidatus Acidiferrum sp.]